MSWAHDVGELKVFTPVAAVRVTKGGGGWVRADRIVAVYKDNRFVRIRCADFGVDLVVVFDGDAPKDVDERVNMLALALWGVSHGD